MYLFLCKSFGNVHQHILIDRTVTVCCACILLCVLWQLIKSIKKMHNIVIQQLLPCLILLYKLPLFRPVSTCHYS